MVGRVKHFVLRHEAILRMLLGVFFLIAAALKVTQTTTTQHGFQVGVHAFASVIERGGVIPDNLALLTAIIVLAVELIIGLGMLSHRAVKMWASITIVFLFMLTAYLLFLQIRGKTQACGCLGQWDTSIPISILRNALLSLACVPSLLAMPSGSRTDTGPLHSASRAVPQMYASLPNRHPIPRQNPS